MTCTNTLTSTLFCATALAAALSGGVANAAYTSFTDPAPGSLILTSISATGSLFVDLGLDSQQFRLVNKDAITYSVPTSWDGTPESEWIIVEWDFNAGTVTSKGSHDVSASLAGISGDWSAAWGTWNAGGAGAGGSYGVYAGDRDGSAATDQHYLSTASSPESTVRATTNSNLIGFNTVGSWHNNQQITGGGNHADVANGANVITGFSSLWQGANGGMKTNWNGFAPFTMTGPADSWLRFYALDGVAGPSSAKVSVSRYAGGFVLDATAGKLIWTVAAVPEASTWAMLLAGLGLLMLVRRKAG